ncbi:MAG: TRAP transporter permease [Deltaproteobacteria bacterium]|jgi:TRAP transporter 4TM/12TM fusion protein|nr:TRAP transporter permease [Deltaproteobacteria bacterium]
MRKTGNERLQCAADQDSAADSTASRSEAEPPPEAAAAENAQRLIKEKESEARTRVLSSPWESILTAVAVLWSLFQLYVTAFPVLDAIRLRAGHIIFMFTLAFFMYPALRRKKKDSGRTGRPEVADWLSLALGVFAFGYMILQYDSIAERGGWFKPLDYFVAALGVLACFEMARRVVSNLAWLAGIFFAYAFLGAFIPGAFGHTGFSWRRVVEHLFWGSQGLLGVGVGVSSTYIFLFVLFGVFLKYSGFSAFINDLALALVGRSAGGPAKVAVIASALMGMINGSALANVATTGAITIPLMKRTGYKAEFAGAVEAVASTGGQFAPPIMGAVGFIMAEFLGVPYTTVMLAAAIPAFLYYLGLIMAVHFEARRLGLKGLSPEHIPTALQVLKKRGHLALPLLVLLFIMFLDYTPLYAATFSILSTVAVSWISPDTRMGPRAILKALNEGARSAVGVGAACVIIGVIIGVVSLTGLGLSFGYAVLRYVGENQLYVGGLCVMILSTILGMGVPGVAAYVIVAAVAIPVLTGIGASPLAAHMFCLFYACLSNITPPVAMSSYVAAGIAQSNQTRTSLIAVRLGLTGFILPFFFLNNPLLLYESGHSPLLTLWALLSASFGVTALAGGLGGWMLGPCTRLMRLLLLTAGILTIDPGLYTDLIGFALFVAVLVQSRKKTASLT